MSAEAIDAMFVVLGQERAAESAPDKRYKAPPAGLGKAIIDAANLWTPTVNSDLMAAQCLHETGGWQSYWARSHNNPAGIGVDGTPGVGNHFPSFMDGFEAQAAHLLNYALGRGAWTMADVRWPEHMPDSYMGSAPTLKGLNGRWATPGTSYGQDIAALANRLVDFANNGTWSKPMATVPKPPMVIQHSARFDGYGHAREYRAFVDHIATGSKASNLSWLAGGSADAKQPSVNYYIAKDGTIYEIVPYQHAPWTNGVDFSLGINAYKPNLANATVKYWFDNKINPNTGSVTTEHEGEAADRLTAAQITSNAWLKAWLHQEVGIPLDRDHWFGHNYIDSVNRPYCPSFDPDEWDALLSQAQARVNAQPLPPVPAAPPPPANPAYFLQTDKYIDTAFWQFWQDNGNVGLFGYPVTGSHLEDGLLTQYFERAVFELHDGNTILLRRLGAQAAAAAGYTGPGIP